MLGKEKSLTQNSIANVLYNLLKVLFPLIYSTYVSHILLASGVGKISFAQNIVQYFTILAALGIPNYGIREIAKIKNSEIMTNKLFNELISINFISTTICALLYFTLVNSIEFFAPERLLYNVVGINILLNYFNVEWFYQGKEEFAYIAVRSFWVKLISLLFIFLFVKKREDYIIYAFISTVVIASNSILNVCNLRKYNIKICLKYCAFAPHIKPIIVLLCSTIAVEMYTLLDTTMLGAMCSEEAVGYYTNSIKLVRILIVVISSIGTVLLPRMSAYFGNKKYEECNELVSKTVKVLLFFFLPCGIGIYMTADQLIPILYGQSFLPAVTTLKIASFLIYALGFSNLFGTQILLAFDSEKKLLVCTIVGAVSNVILNVLFIPIFSQNGAAFASVVSETLVTVLSIIFCKKYIKVSISKKFWVSSVLGLMLMSIYVRLIQIIFEHNMSVLCLSVLGGVTVYFGINYLFKNEILIMLSSKISPIIYKIKKK